MDIKNLANAQPQTPPKTGDNKSATVDYSSQYTIRTMKDDLDALSPTNRPKTEAKAPATLAPKPLQSIAPTAPNPKPIVPMPPPKKPLTPPAAPLPKTMPANQGARFGAPPAGLPIASQISASPAKTQPPKTPPIPTPVPPATQPFNKSTLKVPDRLEPLFDLSKETKPTGSSNKKTLKTVLIVSLLVLLSVATIGFYLWQKMNQPIAETLPTPSASASQTPTPEVSLVKNDGERTLFLADNQNLTDLLLGNFRSSPPAPASLTRILITKIMTDAASNGASSRATIYIEPNKIGPYLNVTFPQEIQNRLTGQSDLFVYAQPRQNPVASTTEVLFRPVLVAEFSKNASSTQDISNSLRQIEPTLTKNFNSLTGKPIPAQTSFSDNTYKGVPIRYINLPDNSLTIDYAVLNNKLLITTSKASMYDVIDRLQSTSP